MRCYVGDLRHVDRKQENVGDVDLPGTLEDAGARNHETAPLHGRPVDEGGGVPGYEDEYFGGVAEPVVADGDPAHDVRRNVVEEDEPQRDPAEQVEAQVAFALGEMHRGCLPPCLRPARAPCGASLSRSCYRRVAFNAEVADMRLNGVRFRNARGWLVSAGAYCFGKGSRIRFGSVFNEAHTGRVKERRCIAR